MVESADIRPLVPAAQALTDDQLVEYYAVADRTVPRLRANFVSSIDLKTYFAFKVGFTNLVKTFFYRRVFLDGIKTLSAFQDRSISLILHIAIDRIKTLIFSLSGFGCHQN